MKLHISALNLNTLDIASYQISKQVNTLKASQLAVNQSGMFPVLANLH